jgi:hypothetical protein
MISTTEHLSTSIEPIRTQAECSNTIDYLNQEEEITNLQNQLIQHIGALEDSHLLDDRKWFQKLIHNNLHNEESEDIDLGILYNITFLDTITAKLLNISVRKIITIDIIKRYIKELWETNEQQQGFLESHILDNPQQREFIEKTLRPNSQIHTVELINNIKDTQNFSQTHKQINNEEEDALMFEKEVEIQEIVMTEAETCPLETQGEKNNIEDNTTSILLNDIKKTRYYETRNRPTQTLNPFYISNTGSFTAGILIANTPGENKHEQKTYLANILRLPKHQMSLIKNSFYNGNGWYTINFQYQHDMINCMEKINNKDEDFKLVHITEGPNAIEPNLKRKEKERQSNKKQAAEVIPQVKLENIDMEKNFYKLSNESTRWGIKMLVGTFPGNNRNEQISILSNTFGIKKDSNLINIEHINGNSWFTGYFQKKQERSQCLSTINKTSTITGINIIELNEIPKKTNIKTTQQTQENRYSEKSDTKPKHQNMSKTKVKILDIPQEFSYNRVMGTLKRYGHIDSLTINNDKKENKSAIVTFNNISLNLEDTWSIPMGDVMARIVLADNIYLITERNQITARLYGIQNNTSATRIMSAIKHMKAKSIHIPKNGRTGKRRKFAIIGFKDQASLEKAISSHVELFGCKTWWSAKDSTKTTKIHTKIDDSETMHSSIKEYSNKIVTSPFESEDPPNIYSKKSHTNNQILKGKKVQTIPYVSQSSFTQDNKSDWTRMASLLERIEDRLNKLEEKETAKNQSEPNAHNRS